LAAPVHRHGNRAAEDLPFHLLSARHLSGSLAPSWCVDVRVAHGSLCIYLADAPCSRIIRLLVRQEWLSEKQISAWYSPAELEVAQKRGTLKSRTSKAPSSPLLSTTSKANLPVRKRSALQLFVSLGPAPPP
jgi:hypothetical protein